MVDGNSRYACFPLAGASPAIQSVCSWVRRVAPTDSTVLLSGESGTGKKLVAGLMHQKSPLSDQPFVTVDCSAATEEQIEAELTASAGGTLFLDEVGALPKRVQGKLLYVLERLPHRRLIAATSRTLESMVAGGEFRDDLYYRLAVVPIVLPPLRSRTEDLTSLIDGILERLEVRLGRPVPDGVTPGVMACFHKYSWPGNVRELESVIEYACLCSRTPRIECADLPDRFTVGEGTAPLQDRIEETEKHELEAALRQSATAADAAERLGISRATLFRKARRLGVTIAELQSHAASHD